MVQLKKKICLDCGPQPVNHFLNWTSELLDYLFSVPFSWLNFLPPKFTFSLEQHLENVFIRVGLIKKDSRYPKDKIYLRTQVFLEAARKRGIKTWALKGPFGYFNHFQMQVNGKVYSFEGLPRAEFLNRRPFFIDDKEKVKAMLQKEGLPVAPGKAFWWYQKGKAKNYARHLGFPLVVKPRYGSLSHHVTVDIQDESSLEKAITCALVYGPRFLVERFLEKAKVVRATVVDFEKVAIIQRVPAHIIGDGHSTIDELIKKKNTDPRRGYAGQKDAILFKLTIDEITQKLLKEQNCQMSSVPPKGEIIYLQEKVILDLGADTVEMTKETHPENILLASKIARLFDARLVGIDFLAEDIRRPWDEQQFAIMELNSLPFIDVHHFPSQGQSVNVADYLVAMVLKYYK